MNNATTMFLVHLSHKWDGAVMLSTVSLGLATVASVRARNMLRLSGSPRSARVASIVTRIVGCLTAVSGCLLLLAAMHLGCANLVGQQHECKQNLKEIGQAILMYAQDYDERLPPAINWVNAIAPDVKSAMEKGDNGNGRPSDPYHCPAVDSGPSYARNGTSGGIKLDDVAAPADYVLLFDAEAKGPVAPGTQVLSGGPELLVKRRHSTGNISFLDGHVNWQLNLDAIPLGWSPKDVPK